MRQPPFAAEVAAAKAQGEIPNVRIRLDRQRWVNFDFTALDKLDVTLIGVDADIAYSRRVAARICSHGARMVVLIHHSLPKWSEFFYGTAS